MRVRFAAALAVALFLGASASPLLAWSHQGHIVCTRLAALRIINDETAPAELREFLRRNMPYDLDAVKRTVLGENVGAQARDHQTGLDGYSTLPDRIQDTDEGKQKIEPYGAPEAKMHFCDLEFFAKDPQFKPDLSSKPKREDIPRDVKDPRWLAAGFIPLRLDESYKNLVTAFGAKNKPINNTDAAKWTGYLAHYLEDCTQPHHSTIDFKSLSYLAGKVPSVRTIKTDLSNGGVSVSYRADRDVNPHGDLEFQLFENANEPRKTWREDFWRELTARIDKISKDAPSPDKFDGFEKSLDILFDSYTYLPAVGKAAQAAYATGKFDAEAFFTSKDTVNGEELTIIQLMAERKARAVIEVEHAIRAAWNEAKAK